MTMQLDFPFVSQTKERILFLEYTTTTTTRARPRDPFFTPTVISDRSVSQTHLPLGPLGLLAACFAAFIRGVPKRAFPFLPLWRRVRGYAASTC